MKFARAMLAAAAVALIFTGQAAFGESDHTGLERVYPSLNTWDLDGVLGIGHTLRGSEYLGLVRVRAGVLFVREPRFWSLGLTAEGLSRRKFALGIEAGLVDDLSGLWTQVGVSRTLTRKSWSGHAAAGYTLFGLELRAETGERAGWQIFGVVRFPVGILVHMLTRQGDE